MADLFEKLRVPTVLAPGAVHLPGRALEAACALIEHIARIAGDSPFRRLTTPGGGQMSVEMTGCGPFGWHSDRRGYRYVREDPLTGRPWPAMPAVFARLARESAAEAGFEGFAPQVCLINRYNPGAKMGLHQDRDEGDVTAPIVSVSLGLPARFLFGGLARTDATQAIGLVHGDVVVWGGASRLAFHGVGTIRAGEHAATGACRYNLTFRKVK